MCRSWYLNSDTKAPQYLSRGGGLGIQTSLDKICSDRESPPAPSVLVSEQFGYRDLSVRGFDEEKYNTVRTFGSFF